MLLDELFEAFDAEVAAPLAAAVQARLQVRHGRHACPASRLSMSGPGSVITHSPTVSCCLDPHAQEAAAARAAGREDWWKLREACLYAVGTVSDALVELAAASGGRGLPLDVPGLMAGILQEDLVLSAPPFLIGRALWVASRCAAGLCVAIWAAAACLAVRLAPHAMPLR